MTNPAQIKLDDQPTIHPTSNKLHPGYQEVHRPWRDEEIFESLRLAFNQAKEPELPVFGGRPFRVRRGRWESRSKGDPFVNGILIQCGIFFLDVKNAYIMDLFSKLRTPELRNSLHQKPYDLLAFHEIIITTSEGEQSNNANHFLVHHLSGAISQIYTSIYTLAKEAEYCMQFA